MTTSAAMKDLKTAVKEAIRETFEERPNWLHEALAVVLEDVALARAISEGRKSKRVSRAEIIAILEGKQ
jgi:hypothetical protein